MPLVQKSSVKTHECKVCKKYPHLKCGKTGVTGMSRGGSSKGLINALYGLCGE